MVERRQPAADSDVQPSSRSADSQPLDQVATDQETSGSAERPALWSGKRWFWGLAIFLLVLDLWSKAWAFEFVRDHGYDRSFAVIDGFFNLVKVENTGTVFGLAQGWTSALIGLRVVAVFALLWFLRQTPNRNRLQVTALALIFSGALGNLYDNLFSDSRGVRDFLQFYVEVDGKMRDFPAFNVADSCICVGAGLLMICMLLKPQER